MKRKLPAIESGGPIAASDEIILGVILQGNKVLYKTYNLNIQLVIQ
jgi:hypothetical protein